MLLLMSLLGMLMFWLRYVTPLFLHYRLSHRLNVLELAIRFKSRIDVHWNCLHVLRLGSGHHSHGYVISIRKWQWDRHLRLSVSITAGTLKAHWSLWTLLPSFLVTVVE